MAGVDETVRELISGWPCEFENRTQALHQIVVLLGGGFEWRGGEAVRTRQNPQACLAFHAEWAQNATMWRAAGMVLSDLEVELGGACPAEGIRGLAKELAVTQGPLRRGPYPATLGSLLATVPEDLTDDWRAAVAEIASVVVPLWRSGIGIGPNPARRLPEVLKRLGAAGLA